MSEAKTTLHAILEKEKAAEIKVKTLGEFTVCRGVHLIDSKEWGRDRTVQLFQFLVSSRVRRAMHKEQIIDRIWEDISSDTADQTFKVALHGIHKVLEPQRKSRVEPKYILRQGITYQLNTRLVWVDATAVEELISLANRTIGADDELSIIAYQKALSMYDGIYLPNRSYEDWSSAERERIQLLAIGAMISLGELMLHHNPMESIRLAQQALLIDEVWEDGYRLQMQAYAAKGNRPMVIKTFKQCEKVLHEEFGIKPLPETRRIFETEQAR